MKVWINGNIVDVKGAIGADDRGVTLGDGIFETLAVVDGAPLRFERHIKRLTTCADVLALPLLCSGTELTQGIQEVCNTENVKEGSVRISLLRGPAPRGVRPPETATPTLMISAISGTVGKGEPVAAIVAKCTRRNDRSPLAAIKSTNYLDAIMAACEADAVGADDAIMLNTRDLVAEATAANVFCRFGDDLVTPPVSDGALPGIMRACVMTVEGAVERSLSVTDLKHADEILLTSSLSIRPVVRIDGEIIGNGTPGEAAARLQDLPRHAI